MAEPAAAGTRWKVGDPHSCWRRAERRTRASALHACVPFRLRRGDSKWPSSARSSRASCSEASRAPRAAPAVARAHRRSAPGRAAPRAVRRAAAGRSGLRLRLRRPPARRTANRPLPPAPRASQQASRAIGRSALARRRRGRRASARRLAGRAFRPFLQSSVFSSVSPGTVVRWGGREASTCSEHLRRAPAASTVAATPVPPPTPRSLTKKAAARSGDLARPGEPRATAAAAGTRAPRTCYELSTHSGAHIEPTGARPRSARVPLQSRAGRRWTSPLAWFISGALFP